MPLPPPLLSLPTNPPTLVPPLLLSNFSSGLGVEALQTAEAVSELAPASVVSNVVATALAVSVSTTVVASIAASTAVAGAAGAATGAIGGTVGAAASGGASGAAGGSASSAGGAGDGIAGGLTLLFGAQRFVLAASLPANVSEVHQEVATSLDWTTGNINIGFDPSFFAPANTSNADCLVDVNASVDAVANSGAAYTDEQHAALAEQTTSQRCKALQRILLIGLLTLTVVLFLQGIAVLWWRSCINRRFYQGKSQRFVRFPSICVFPGLTFITISLFLTGIVGRSAALITSRFSSCYNVHYGGCRALGYVGVTIAASYIVVSVVLLRYFDRRFRVATWSVAKTSASPSDVADPFFRALSKLRLVLCWQCCLIGDETRKGRAVIDRQRGKFVPPQNETAEPARTERLLKSPFIFARPRANDMLDAYGFALLARSGGFSFQSTAFEVRIITTQLVGALINGIGRGAELQPGSPAAVFQMALVFYVQVSFAWFVWMSSPSADRIMSLLVGLQFMLEAAQTGVLLVSVSWDVPDLAFVSLVCSICAVLAPVIHRGYEIFVVTFLKLWCEGKCTFKTTIFSFVALAVLVPSTLLRLIGYESNGDDRVATHGTDDLQKLIMRQTNQQVAIEVERQAAVTLSTALDLAQRQAAYVDKKNARRFQRNLRRGKGGSIGVGVRNPADPRPEVSHSTDAHDERDPERIALDVDEDAREQAAFEQEDSIIRALSLSRTSSLAEKETQSPHGSSRLGCTHAVRVSPHDCSPAAAPEPPTPDMHDGRVDGVRMSPPEPPTRALAPAPDVLSAVPTAIPPSKEPASLAIPRKPGLRASRCGPIPPGYPPGPEAAHPAASEDRPALRWLDIHVKATLQQDVTDDAQGIQQQQSPTGAPVEGHE